MEEGVNGVGVGVGVNWGGGGGCFHLFLHLYAGTCTYI